MTGPFDKLEGAALWRRLRAAEGPGAALEPDAMTLAAYAEDRLRGEALDRVEAWLAEHPEAIADMILARGAARARTPAPEVAPAALIARAAAAPRSSDDARDQSATVIPFRAARPPTTLWRAAVTWGSLAASIVATSLVGFALGTNAYATLSAGPAAQFFVSTPPQSADLDQELFGTSTSVLGTFVDETGS